MKNLRQKKTKKKDLRILLHHSAG